MWPGRLHLLYWPKPVPGLPYQARVRRALRCLRQPLSLLTNGPFLCHLIPPRVSVSSPAHLLRSCVEFHMDKPVSAETARQHCSAIGPPRTLISPRGHLRDGLRRGERALPVPATWRESSAYQGFGSLLSELGCAQRWHRCSYVVGHCSIGCCHNAHFAHRYEIPKLR